MGPLTPPVNGQAVAFTTVFKSYPGKKILVDSSTSGSIARKIIQYFHGLLRTIFIALFASYDLVYFTCSRTYKGAFRDVMLITIAGWRGIRVVNHLHGADLHSFYMGLSSISKRVLKYAYLHVDHTIILLEDMRGEFRDLAPQMTTTTVINSFDEFFCDLSENLALEGTGKRLLYFSNLMYSKGIIYLLEAFEVLKKSYPDLSLDIVGQVSADDCYSYDQMKESIAKYQRVDGIRFYGGLYANDKVSVLKNADIFILPTFYKSEALPISMLEAMRAGCAVVCTRHNYLPSLMTEEMGFLIEKKSVKGIVVAVSNLLDNEKKLKSIKEFNYSFAKDNSSPSAYIANVLRVLRADV